VSRYTGCNFREILLSRYSFLNYGAIAVCYHVTVCKWTCCKYRDKFIDFIDRVSVCTHLSSCHVNLEFVPLDSSGKWERKPFISQGIISHLPKQMQMDKDLLVMLEGFTICICLEIMFTMSQPYES
jgi:hypothetical protein